jgi:hypothetical protein
MPHNSSSSSSSRPRKPQILNYSVTLQLKLSDFGVHFSCLVGAGMKN